uniref:Structural maintenance of chromosomes protein n=1 Tax=Geotrypetes seraphini TaxID=260995 RepID=A0A6P8RSX2_GEOSA|nr:structural maintenance of chromosomes protein 1B isoform X1 [Geotrypetes seraphini]
MGYLKLLLLEDFKSWRGRQVIGPFKRFNCIIGPNGSGKSNIMDALSFVMGEKTANLRVKSVRELIHGANIGKPVSSTASVCMVYSEECGEEISFSRIVVGGSTEFRFNDKTVRRSAYTAELEKIGIIVKARNCLVFQGEVESIAMKKPKERTRLFEQISNSWELAEEYEKKKKIMHHAEEDAQFNYNKKKNVAAEHKHVKQEKEEAERYNTLIKELQESRIQLQLFKLFHNEKKISAVNITLNEKNEDVTRRKDTLFAAEKSLKAKKKELGKLSRELLQIEKEVKVHEMTLNHIRPQYIKAKENTAHHIRKIEAAKKSLVTNEIHFAKQFQDIQEMETEIADIEEAWRNFESSVEKEIMSRGRDVDLEESQLEQYKQLKELVRKKVAILAHELEKLQWELKADQERTVLEQRRQKELEGNIKQIEEQIEDYKKRLEKIDEYIATCTDSLEQLKQREEILADEIENSKRRMGEVNEELNSIVSDLQNARIDHHESHRQKMRIETLENLKRMYHDSVFGRLFDLCNPIHKKYQLAVTKVFGHYMNAIVVSTERAARDCIRFLKEERAEPETFLALDYLDVKPINEKLREIRGAKMIIDVVHTATASLKKVIHFVCGNGLVCETVKDAKQIAFDGPERQKTVALDGTLFLKSGVISGGSSDLRFKARAWDEKEINELKGKKEKLMNELRDLMKIKRKDTDLKQVQAQAQGTQTRLKYSQNELELIKKKHLANCYREKSKLESEMVNLESQLLMLKKGCAERTEKIEDIQKKINEVEDELFKEFCEDIGVKNIREYENEYIKEQQEIDRKRLAFENQKTRLTIQLDYSRGQLEKEGNKVKKLKEVILCEEKELIKLKENESQILQTVDGAMVELKQIKNLLILKKSEVGEVQNQVEEARKKLLTINREVMKIQKETISIEISLEQQRLKRHNLLLECKVQDLQISLLLGSLEEISEIELRADLESTQTSADIYETERNLQIDYNSLSEDLKDLRTDEEVAAQLTSMQQQTAYQESILLKTATPNLRALEKLQNVKDKFQESVDAFEVSRRKARLCRQEFEHVKKRRYDLFSQCFEHVSVAIDQIYKKLCRNTSAQAFLSPENLEEPYLEGISYNCVAPGKRFMPMDNLSGGEKSVAALALVFAIHSFRPAPFFVLDEVDAALDNTNIGKVTSYIREQAREQVQMLVISLKEEFYSKADALIGVCPEQDDCMFSQVLTLDLMPYEENDDIESREEYR